MQQSIATIAYLVRDYDEAIKFFVEKIGFELVEDTCLEQEHPGKRWVVVAFLDLYGNKWDLIQPSTG